MPLPIMGKKDRESGQNYRGEGEYDERRILQGIYR